MDDKVDTSHFENVLTPSGVRKRLAELEAENERLREMYANEAHKRNVLQGEWHDLRAQVAALTKDNDEIHELAEHYRVENGRLQAKIDRLMFEYCPDEMTRSQVEEFQRHQVCAWEPKQ